MAIPEDHQELVELGAVHLELVTGNFVADVTGLAIVSHFEGFECDLARVYFVEAAALGQARIERAIFFEQSFQMANHVFGEALEVLLGLGQLSLGLLHLLTMLVDIEEGNPADAYLEEALDVRIDKFTNELALERLEAFVNGLENRLVAAALFDLLVDALFDEDSFQGAEMEFVIQLGKPHFELALQQFHKLLRVRFQDFTHCHLDRTIVADENQPAGDRDFAIGKSVERVDKLVRAYARGSPHLDFNLFRGEIVEALDLDFAFAGSVLDGCDQRFGGGGRRNLFDQDGCIILGLYLGPHDDAPAAILITSR